MVAGARSEAVFGEPRETSSIEERTNELLWGLNGSRNGVIWGYRQELSGRSQQGATAGSKAMDEYRDAMSGAVFALCAHKTNTAPAKGHIAEADLLKSLFLIAAGEEQRRLSALDSIYAGERAGSGNVERVGLTVVGGPVSRFAQKRSLPEHSSAQDVAAAHLKRMQEILGFCIAGKENLLAYGKITNERYVPLGMLRGIVPRAIELLLGSSIPAEIGELKRSVAEAKIRKGWLRKIFGRRG